MDPFLHYPKMFIGSASRQPTIDHRGKTKWRGISSGALLWGEFLASPSICNSISSRAWSVRAIRWCEISRWPENKLFEFSANVGNIAEKRE